VIELETHLKRRMNPKESNKILLEAVRTWGKEAQINMIEEECIELAHAICKLRRKRGDPDKKLDNLIDELADVKLMMMQADIIFEDLKDRIDERMDFKLNRVKERLKEKI